MRILNEKGIKDKELRNLIIKVRDESYDAMASLRKDDLVLEIESKTKLYQTFAYTTMAIMRISRQI